MNGFGRLPRRALGAIVVFVLCAAAFSFSLAASPDNTSYQASVERWRQEYEASLKADYGWLSVSGLFWLHEGANEFGSGPLNDIVLPSSAPAVAGTFEFHSDHGSRTVAHLKPGLLPR